jgi:hypothetical protein
MVLSGGAIGQIRFSGKLYTQFHFNTHQLVRRIYERLLSDLVQIFALMLMVVASSQGVSQECASAE